MKKRIISLLLIICMAVSMIVTANAEQEWFYDEGYIVCINNHTGLAVDEEAITEEIPEYNDWKNDGTIKYQWQYYKYNEETETEEYIDIPGATGSTLTDIDIENYESAALIITGGDGSKEYMCDCIWLPDIYYQERMEADCVFSGHKAYYYCWHCDDMWLDKELTQQVEYDDIEIEPSAEFCTIKYFTDAPKPGNWAHNGIELCYMFGYMYGTSETTFEPNKVTNRAMVITTIYRMMGEPSVEGLENPFTDLKEGAYYEDAVIWAANNEIVTGTTATTFDPTADITREQIATIFYRYLKWFAGDSFSVYDDIIVEQDFPDEEKVSNYAKEAMDFMTGVGVINGVAKDNDTFIDPKGKTTRAQMATIISRIYILQYILAE